MEIIAAVTGVFTSVGEWIVSFIPSLLTLFYTAPVEGVGGGLTILGVLAIMALAISVVLLVIDIITRFFQFRA